MFNLWVGNVPWRRKWQLTPVFLPGKSHGQSSLVGYSPWGRKELDTTEHTHTHTVPVPCRVNFTRENISHINKGYPVFLIENEKGSVINLSIKTNKHCSL